MHFRLFFLAVLVALSASAQQLDPSKDLVHYTGTVMSNVDYHDGQLQPAIGVHCQQIMRANREMPETADGYGWTYNHAPMIAYWNGRFYVEYLSDPVSEHVPGGQTLLVTSENGTDWSFPEVIFPEYVIPEGFHKTANSPKADGKTTAVMHQRVGFYVSPNSGKLLAIAFYGVSLFYKDDPNDGDGIGRVVREINRDGSFGPIYFLHYNHLFNPENEKDKTAPVLTADGKKYYPTAYPFYKKSKDKKFVAACDEILSNPLYTMQMVEESDRNDPMIPLQRPLKAFSYYHLDNGDVVGLWKHALTSISHDGGKTWYESINRALGFVNSNAKIWGQRTSDGRFATIYNPSEYRWPLAISTSDDGLNYTDLMLVHGEITPLRYGGNYKNRGPQYVRGIQEGNGTPEDGKIWLTYSMNKEDIWVCSIPVPVTCKATEHQKDVFNEMADGHELDAWNTYDLKWASTKIEKDEAGVKALVLRDRDPFDYAMAEKVFPSSDSFSLAFEVEPGQNDCGLLQAEVQDAKGQPSIRVSFEADGKIYTKAGARYNSIGSYKPGEKYRIELKVDCLHRSYTVRVNRGAPSTKIFFAPASRLERFMLRTGSRRTFPDPDTPAETYTDLENASKVEPQQAVFRVYSFETTK